MNMDLAYKSRWQRKKYINDMAVDKDDARKCFETLFFAEERVGRTVEDFTLDDFDDWRDTLPQEKKALYTSIVSGFLAWSRISPNTKEYPQKLFEERLLCTGDD